ncbi:hypothetical protein K5F27_16780 [Acinetobacter baumannii]|nr:hypothetical protein [Acinetobacter baumannii]MCJ9185073.1 hypothetical protein [Acinetobacter baumannii]MCJ9327913.1 hypothetical protein [Acinetobacter baumannii]
MSVLRPSLGSSVDIQANQKGPFHMATVTVTLELKSPTLQVLSERADKLEVGINTVIESLAESLANQQISTPLSVLTKCYNEIVDNSAQLATYDDSHAISDFFEYYIVVDEAAKNHPTFEEDFAVYVELRMASAKVDDLVIVPQQEYGRYKLLYKEF